MIGALDDNLYIDALTGLPNFFEFIESDAMDLFDESGSVIIFDLAKFGIINKKYGREFGDLCLKYLSGIISDVISQFDRAHVFKTNGDEFTVILPRIYLKDAEKAAYTIKSSYAELINKNGCGDTDVHILLLSYYERISSITQFYKIMFNQIFSKIEGIESELSKDNWLEQMIESFTSRIKETLMFSNKVYNMALTDDISCLPNHRAADLYLKRLVERSKAENKEFSLLFIDGDNLRRYNKVSYKTGNKMINDLSIIISKSIRKSDKLFRWLSGDEFLVVFEGTNYKNVVNLAERIRKTVQRETLNWIYPITVSIGVSSFPRDGRTVDDIINKAEKANLYAKNTGKNKVVEWSAALG